MLAIFLTIEDDADRSLAEQLYLTYKDRMYRIAFSVLHNKEDAEDAVMDAVINIVKHISMFRGNNRNKTESLIVIIIRNVSINRYHYNEHRTTADINEYVDSIPDDTNPADSIIESEDYETLLKQIRTLEPIYRDVLLMKYLYEYENSLIAEMTGVSETTVRVRLMRAKVLLKKALGQEEKS